MECNEWRKEIDKLSMTNVGLSKFKLNSFVTEEEEEEDDASGRAKPICSLRSPTAFGYVGSSSGKSEHPNSNSCTGIQASFGLRDRKNVSPP